MSNQFKRFDSFIKDILPFSNDYKFDNKIECVNQHIIYMLNRCQSMFKWEGLPDTIPARVLELYLQINGNVCFYSHEDKLYVFTGGLGGPPNVYYMPTLYTIANPALQLNKTLKIDEECVVISNDSMYIGLIPMFKKYATFMTETELSISVANINSRIINLISAPDDRTKESAEKVLSDILNGKLGIIGENPVLDGIRSLPYGTSSNSNSIINLIELEQYLKASWFNELGLNANYNMKRESLNSSESQLNDDALLPLIDNMLECRRIGIDKVNEMFGTNITVSFSSSWEDNLQEIELEHEQMSVRTDEWKEVGDIPNENWEDEEGENNGKFIIK